LIHTYKISSLTGSPLTGFNNWETILATLSKLPVPMNLPSGGEVWLTQIGPLNQLPLAPRGKVTLDLKAKAGPSMPSP
jgi:hypothetical protein